jgi:D-inositol-3-phosphate glycosyltransferase
MTARTIAMVSEHASPLATVGGTDAGGQNVFVAALATQLARHGHQVVVHTRRDDPSLPSRVRLGPGVVIEHVDAGPAEELPKDQLLPYMDAFADGLARSWERARPDVAHSHFWMSGRAALAAAPPLGVPVAHTFHALGTVKRRHQGADDTSPPTRIAEERALIAGVGRVVATCRDEASELARLGATPERVAIVPCGVDLEAFTPAGPVEPRTPGRWRLVVVGRLVPRKGIGDVVAALPHLPDCELVVAGGPPAEALDHDAEANCLRELAAAAGVIERVHLRGRVTRAAMPALLRSADVVVCAPWYEPFGLVPLEAMACGVPVVATAVGGLLDTVVDGVTGLHAPPREPEALAAAIRVLLDDPQRRRRLGENGIRRVHRHYGWARIAEQIAAVYEQLLAEVDTAAERCDTVEGILR